MTKFIQKTFLIFYQFLSRLITYKKKMNVWGKRENKIMKFEL